MKTIIQIFAILLLQLNLHAQIISIYRGGLLVKTFSGSYSIEAAVDSAISGDSLVLSPHLFAGRRVQVNKDLVLQGTQSLSDSTRITSSANKSIFYISSKSTTTTTRVVFRDVIVLDAYLGISYTHLDLKLDSLYGCAIKAFENTDVLITGNCIFRNCKINSRSPAPYIYDTSFSGGVIYSNGKLSINGNTRFINNEIIGRYGLVCSIKELYISDNVLFDSNYSGAGGAIAASGIVTLRNNTKLLNNGSGDGGCIFLRNATLSIHDSVQVTGNTAYMKSGGGIYAENSDIILQNRTIICGNFGNGLYLHHSNLEMKDSAVIAFNAGNYNLGAGIYNKGGNIKISGGQIIGNYYYFDSIGGKGMAIYNDTIQGKPAPVLHIANARIFNPTTDIRRTNEVYNETGVTLSSDSTWWGESDTSGLIFNNGSATTSLNSWIVADWSLNKGIPIGKDTSFPIDAYFRLNSGAAIPPKMFWMLKGLYACDSGKFNPDTADMQATNFISTQYTAAYTTGLVTILATVDADSFKNIQLVTGLDIQNFTTGKINHYDIYPNPATTSLTISSENINRDVILKLYDLAGKEVLIKKLSFRTQKEDIQFNLPGGNYIIELNDQSGLANKILTVK